MPSELYGVFREETSIGLNVPYDEKVKVPSRFQGKQMLTHVDVKGKVAKEAFIDRNFQLTTAGDVYLDPAVVQRELEKRVVRGPRPTTKPFFPPNPTSVTGLTKGSLNGTFGPASQLVDTNSVLADREMLRRSQKAPPQLRNFLTTPARQGGMGFPFQDRTIGGGTFVHMPDQYLRGRFLEKDLRNQARAKIPKPFMGGRSSATFAKDTDIYASPPPEKAPPPRRSATADSRPRWCPTNAPRKGRGIYGVLSPLTYVSCPDQPARAGTAAGTARVFRPSSGPHQRLSIHTVNPYLTDPRKKDPADYFFG